MVLLSLSLDDRLSTESLLIVKAMIISRHPSSRLSNSFFRGTITFLSIMALFCINLESARASDLYILSVQASTYLQDRATVHLDNQAGSDVGGWSITLCHDPSSVALDEIFFGSSLQNLPAPPDFHDVAFFSSGFTITCIIDNSGNVSLVPASNHLLYVIDYNYLGFNNYSDIEFCPTSTTGPGLDSYIESGGQAYDPITIDSFIFNAVLDPGVIYEIERTIGTYDEQTGEGSVVVEPLIFPALYGLDSVTGFSMALSHDPDVLQIDSIIAWDEIADLNGGAGPDLMLVELMSDGWTVDVTFGPTGMESVDFPGGIYPLRATYSTQPGAIPLGNCVGSWLRFTNSFGVPNAVDYFPGCCTNACHYDDLVILIPTTASFQRGDCNGDTARNLADAIFLLGVLFTGGGPAYCQDACDNNDDGSIDISDAIYLLTFLFANGAAPPEPNQLCGSDPTSDGLGCASNTCP